MKLIKNEGLTVSGHWRLTAKHIKTGQVIIKEGENLIVNTGKWLVADMLKDTAGYDTGLTSQQIGTSNTAPAVGDTTLTAWAATKAVTSKTRLLNVVTWSTFFTAGESTFNIKEAGIFGHSTGLVMFNHYLVSFDNSGGLYDITMDVVITFG